MRLLDQFKKTKNETEAETEEFTLPELHIRDFEMTSELYQRRLDEELKKKYGVKAVKQGTFY